MQPIPVDDYQLISCSTRYLLHDVWSVDRWNASIRMSLSIGYSTASQITDMAHALKYGYGLVDKREYGSWTLLVFRVGSRTALYHAVRDKYDAVPQSPPIKFKYKNYTGEFIRALRSIPEYKIPMDGPWLRIQSIEPILGRDCPFLLTTESAKHRWGVTHNEACQRLFKDYPSVPLTEYNGWRHMTGYEVLRQYGCLDYK